MRRRRRYSFALGIICLVCFVCNVGIVIAVLILQARLASGPERMPATYCRNYDTSPPILELRGPASQTVVVGEEYHEYGAVATDDCGDFEAVVADGEVDTSSVGEYRVVYEAFDLVGNRGETSRVVRVVPQSRGTIYLTFDDGPSQYTAQLLDVLAKYGVKATFFVTGRGDDELIAREFREGHAVGLHSFSHDYAEIYSSPDAFFDDLGRISERVKRLTGEESRLMRFPGGSSNTVSRKYDGGQKIMSTLTGEVAKRGLTYFDWNVLSGDAGQTTDTTVVFENVMSGLVDGGESIVLQHDTKGFSVDAVEQIIIEAMSRGFTFDKLNIDSYAAHHRINN